MNFKFNKGIKKFKKENTYGVLNGLYENDKIKLIQNDLCKSIPELFDEADAIICAVPWPRGYKNFIENSIASDTSYEEYLNSVTRVLNSGKPAFILASKQVFFRNKLKPQKIISQIDFSEYKGYYCDIFIYNFDEKIEINSTENLRDFVTTRFSCVLDFSCGYAESLRYYANKNDCKLILADIDYDCLSEIIEKENLKCLKK